MDRRLNTSLTWIHQDDTIWGCSCLSTREQCVTGTKNAYHIKHELCNRDWILGCCLKIYWLPKLGWRHITQVDKHGTKWSFEVGDWVYLWLYPYWQSSVATCHSTILAHVQQALMHFGKSKPSQLHTTWSYQTFLWSIWYFMFPAWRKSEGTHGLLHNVACTLRYEISFFNSGGYTRSIGSGSDTLLLQLRCLWNGWI